MLAILGYLTADLLACVLPAAACEALAVGLARLAFALRPPARRVLERNLERLDPGASPAEQRSRARRAFEHFALSLVDFLRLPRMAPDELDRAIELRGAQHLETARAGGRGVILLSAHIGNWEWGAAWLAAAGARLHLVARPHPNPLVEAFFTRRRRARGVGVLPDRPLWLAAAQALRQGDWVALMGDRPATSSGRGEAQVAGSVCAWAAALSRRTGATVLPAIMVRLSPGRYAACFEPPLSPEACAAGGYRAALLHYLEHYPGQWFAFEPLPEGVA